MRKNTKALTAAGAATATAALVGTALATAAPASAMELERERWKTCGTGMANLSAEKEYGQIDVDFEVENVAAGRTWRLQIAHNGKVKAKATLPTDNEGDVDLGRQVRDTRGKDTFVAKAMGPNGEVCRVKLAI